MQDLTGIMRCSIDKIMIYVIMWIKQKIVICREVIYDRNFWIIVNSYGFGCKVL